MIRVIFVCDRCSKEKNTEYPEAKMDDLMYELRSYEVKGGYLCDECEEKLKLLKEECKQYRKDEINKFLIGSTL